MTSIEEKHFLVKQLCDEGYSTEYSYRYQKTAAEFSDALIKQTKDLSENAKNLLTVITAAHDSLSKMLDQTVLGDAIPDKFILCYHPYSSSQKTATAKEKAQEIKVLLEQLTALLEAGKTAADKTIEDMRRS